MLTYFPEQLYKCAIVSCKKEAMNTTQYYTQTHTFSFYVSKLEVHCFPVTRGSTDVA